MIIFRPLRREEGMGAALGLIGLLVSVTIILVLIKIYLGSHPQSEISPSTAKAKIEEAQRATCQANLAAIKRELLGYQLQNGQLPETLSELSLRPSTLRCPSLEDYLYDPETGEVSCPLHSR
ncbi:hypothetical protein KKH56_02835 [bacterium]|nr:hypothetical protein [bacterium]